jgi:hypothetical protein
VNIVKVDRSEDLAKSLEAAKETIANLMQAKVKVNEELEHLVIEHEETILNSNRLESLNSSLHE